METNQGGRKAALLVLIVFALAFLFVEAIAAIERRVDFYASSR